MNFQKLLKSLSAVISAVGLYLSSQVTAVAADASAGGEMPSTGSALLSTLILPMVVLIFLWLLMIRPQQKQEKETKAMQESLQPGDEIITRGGIVGLVLRVDNNTQTVLIETGSNHVKIRITQDAVVKNITAEEAQAAEKAKEKKDQKPGISLGKSKDE